LPTEIVLPENRSFEIKGVLQNKQINGARARPAQGFSIFGFSDGQRFAPKSQELPRCVLNPIVLREGSPLGARNRRVIALEAATKRRGF
jgi:hypothetical protein